MWNPRENMERREGTEKSVAVAVDKDKTSQYALKWALDNVVPRDHALKLVHVKARPTAPHPALAQNDGTLTEHQADNQVSELLLPFRCFCTRRRVECDTVILEDPDVAKALIEYVCQYGVEILLLGAGSRTGLSRRLFKTADIPGNVLKWAPDFCTVYLVSKGKLSGVRNATRPVPALSAPGATLPTQRNLAAEFPFPAGNESWYDELSPPETDITAENSERLSTDSTFFAFYENLGSELMNPTSSRKSDMEGQSGEFESLYSEFGPPTDPSFPPEPKSLGSDRIPSSPQIADNQDNEIRRLKTELKQTMEMYHAACKQVVIVQQKAKELEQWKINEEKRLQEARVSAETASLTVEEEKAKFRELSDALEAVQKLFEMEVKKRVNAETRALREEKKVLDALALSHIAFKYQSLFHIALVLLLFYFCYPVFG